MRQRKKSAGKEPIPETEEEPLSFLDRILGFFSPPGEKETTGMASIQYKILRLSRMVSNRLWN